MKCPVCGTAELIHDTRDMPFTYKGETTLITAVTGDFCPACAESILDAAESERVKREMRAFSKQVKAAIHTSSPGLPKKPSPTAAYNKWLKAEVQEAINDTSPTIPHADVMKEMRSVIAKIRTTGRRA